MHYRLRLPPEMTPHQTYDRYMKLGQYDQAERIARDYNLGDVPRRHAAMLFCIKLRSCGETEAAEKVEQEYFGMILPETARADYLGSLQESGTLLQGINAANFLIGPVSQQ